MTKRWFAIAMLAVACGGDKEETTDTTTDTTDTTDTVPTTPPTTFEVDPEADLTDIEVVAALGTLSAVNQYIHLSLLFDMVDSVSDPACPTVDATDPADIVYTGGCTDSTGIEWTGTLHYQESADAVVLVLSDGFGVVALPFACYNGQTKDRRVSLDGTITVDLATSAYEADLAGTESVFDLFTCEGGDRTYALEYSGVVGTFGYDQVFSGSGRYTDPVFGRVDVQTLNEIATGACSTEVDSGVTLLTTSEHQATIVYDGAVDCDTPGASVWTLDGASQGPIAVGCSTAPSAGWLALLPLGWLARRKR